MVVSRIDSTNFLPLRHLHKKKVMYLSKKAPDDMLKKEPHFEDMVELRPGPPTHSNFFQVNKKHAASSQ